MAPVRGAMMYEYDTAMMPRPCNANRATQPPASSGVDRSNKAAPPPELESGEAMEGMNASGGGSKVEGSGKGPIEATVDKEAEKQN